MEQMRKDNRVFKFLKTKGFILLLDIIAVNLAYIVALLLRFFVHGEFKVSVSYLDYFWKIAPFYTVAAIVVFFIFRLYGGLTQYAGLNDLNRIIKAHIVTTILHVIISIIVLTLSIALIFILCVYFLIYSCSPFTIPFATFLANLSVV